MSRRNPIKLERLECFGGPLDGRVIHVPENVDTINVPFYDMALHTGAYEKTPATAGFKQYVYRRRQKDGFSWLSFCGERGAP